MVDPFFTDFTGTRSNSSSTGARLVGRLQERLFGRAVQAIFGGPFVNGLLIGKRNGADILSPGPECCTKSTDPASSRQPLAMIAKIATTGKRRLCNKLLIISSRHFNRNRNVMFTKSVW